MNSLLNSNPIIQSSAQQIHRREPVPFLSGVLNQCERNGIADGGRIAATIERSNPGPPHSCGKWKCRLILIPRQIAEGNLRDQRSIGEDEFVANSPGDNDPTE